MARDMREAGARGERLGLNRRRTGLLRRPGDQRQRGPGPGRRDPPCHRTRVGRYCAPERHHRLDAPGERAGPATPSWSGASCVSTATRPTSKPRPFRQCWSRRRCLSEGLGGRRLTGPLEFTVHSSNSPWQCPHKISAVSLCKLRRMGCLRQPRWPSSTGRRRHGVGLCYRWHLRVPALGLGRGHVDVDGVNVLDDHLSCYELLGRLLAAASRAGTTSPPIAASQVWVSGQGTCSVP